jgi:hypothetical protein
LRVFDAATLRHLLLAFLLLVEEAAFAVDAAAIARRVRTLPERRQRFMCDRLVAKRGLYWDFEPLPRDRPL